MNASIQIRLSVIFFLLGILTLQGNAEEVEVFLEPPGLRLTKDPSYIIPAFYQYSNKKLVLPDYRDSSGKPAKGWAMEIIKTRRFSSDQSARIFFRISDLSHTTVFRQAGSPSDMRIWPAGTVIVLEAFKSEYSVKDNAKPVEIVVMSKINDQPFPSPAYYPANWSYAVFTSEGKPSFSSNRVHECHQCHSIAFYLTGDSIYTQFQEK
ncbi:MAG: cytochrome P460 family protein [Nitrospirota bacterium]